MINPKGEIMAETKKQDWRKKKRQHERGRKFVIFLVLSLGGFLFMAPFLWMISTSFKSSGTVQEFPPKLVPQDDVTVTLPVKELVLGTPVVNRKPLPTAWMTQGKNRVRVAMVSDDQTTQTVRVLDKKSTNYNQDLKISKKDIGSGKVVFDKITKFAIHFSNYPESLKQMNYMLNLRNTCVILISVLVGQLFSASIVAYGFARLKFPGRNFLFFVMLSTMMLPAIVTQIPVYMMFKYLHAINTFIPLTIPAFFGGGAFFIFLLRQFFMTIPVELEDAARIDGCNNFQIFWRIFVPLSKPALTTVAIFSFMGSWNDFMGPLIYLRTPDKYTLALGLDSFKGFYSTEYQYLMAASVVVVAPLILLFFSAQKLFVKGIVMTGMKS